MAVQMIAGTTGDAVGRRPRDEGAALLITMMVIGLVTVLTSVIVAVTVDDLSSSRRTRDAAAALDASEAGIAQALAFLRTNGVRDVSCVREPATSPLYRAGCTSPWTDPAGAVTPLDSFRDTQSYRAWIEPIAPLSATQNPGRYRIHATGFVGSAADPVARREVELDVFIGSRETGLPLGMFGRSVEGAGNYGLTRVSIFSTGCIYSRKQIKFTDTVDAAYGIPVGAHSAGTVTETNGNNPTCDGTHESIHDGGKPCGPAQASGPLGFDYPYDHDVRGGPVASTGCASLATTYPQYYGTRDLDGDGSTDVSGTWLKDAAALQNLFGIDEDPISGELLAELREVARNQVSTQSTGARRSHLFEQASGIPVPNPAENPHSVLFIDLLGGPDEGDIVDLKELGGAWARTAGLAASDAACASRSLLIVITGGQAKLNADHQMAASLVLPSRAPFGKIIKHNGTANMIGTVFADFVDLAGTGTLSLDECFIANLSPALLTVQTERYREVDR